VSGSAIGRLGKITRGGQIAVALCGVLTASSGAIAASLEADTLAVYAAYADYCEPDFLDTMHVDADTVDRDLEARWVNVLNGTYGGNCSKFGGIEVVKYKDASSIATLPDFQRPGAAQLTLAQAMLAGADTWLRAMSRDNHCAGPIVAQLDTPPAIVAHVRDKTRAGDLMEVATQAVQTISIDIYARSVNPNYPKEPCAVLEGWITHGYADQYAGMMGIND
jgi:hypothetical protein